MPPATNEAESLPSHTSTYFNLIDKAIANAFYPERESIERYHATVEQHGSTHPPFTFAEQLWHCDELCEARFTRLNLGIEEFNTQNSVRTRFERGCEEDGAVRGSLGWSSFGWLADFWESMPDAFGPSTMPSTTDEKPEHRPQTTSAYLNLLNHAITTSYSPDHESSGRYRNTLSDFMSDYIQLPDDQLPSDEEFHWHDFETWLVDFRQEGTDHRPYSEIRDAEHAKRGIVRELREEYQRACRAREERSQK
ncbi:MAG: hypothetical protein Q9162_000585 [Coniocarpon cinnabarinum]